MIPLTLAEIAGITGGELVHTDGSAVITGTVEFDSRQIGPGDVIALLGKGHERGQEVNGQMLPFDDRIELAEALTAAAGGHS